MNLRPDLPEQSILQIVHEEYGLQYSEAEFLAIGADPNSAAYRLSGMDIESGFLKLRKENFEESSLFIPAFLRKLGVENIIAPVSTRDGRLWTRLGEFKLLLHPFIQGRSASAQGLSDEQRIELGAALARIHSLPLPPGLAARVMRETYSPIFRQSLVEIQQTAATGTWQQPVAKQLVELMKHKWDEISQLIQRAGYLAQILSDRSLPLVLCHSDLHAWNILVDSRERLYIVDWDNPILAPKERDLMFIGAGIDQLWPDEKQAAYFYEGYGPCTIDHECLAYYRYERIVQDMVAYAEEVFHSGESHEDLEDAYRRFAANFKPGSTIEMAHKAWQAAAP